MSREAGRAGSSGAFRFILEGTGNMLKRIMALCGMAPSITKESLPGDDGRAAGRSYTKDEAKRRRKAYRRRKAAKAARRRNRR